MSKIATKRSRSGEIDALFRGSSLRKASSLDLEWQLSRLSAARRSQERRPGPHLEPTVTGMLDQVIAWGGALTPLRTPKSD